MAEPKVGSRVRWSNQYHAQQLKEQLRTMQAREPRHTQFTADVACYRLGVMDVCTAILAWMEREPQATKIDEIILPTFGADRQLARTGAAPHKTTPKEK